MQEFIRLAAWCIVEGSWVSKPNIQELITGDLAVSRSIGDFDFMSKKELDAIDQMVTCYYLPR
jgi:hypothetical protein